MRLQSLPALLLVIAGCVAPPPPELPPGAMFVSRDPPELQTETPPASPGSGSVWLPGYWRWNGADYEWVPGRWVTPPAGYRVWEPGRWIHTGKGWFWVEGHWR